jgi:exopolysaccharide/PEP-CTERM locus tyrosine autokinase
MKPFMNKLRPPAFGAVVEAMPANEDAVGKFQSVRRIRLDIEALRQAGYLPEPGKVRRLAEAYRHIKRPVIAKALLPAAPGAADPRVVMLASALPGDGKTFTSINLAMSMARERDLSVVLVDGDVVKRDSSRMFGVENERGLLDAVADPAIDVESLVLPTDVPGLSVLSAGTPDEGATEVLASARMAVVTAALIARKARRLVVFDSPPLLLASESRSIAQVCGQVIMVVCAGKTPQRAILDALGGLPHDKAVALVLNLTNPGVGDAYYGYGAYAYRDDADAE